MESKPVERGGPPPRSVVAEPATPPRVEAAETGWEGLEETSEFKQLVSARWRFVVPATIFFLVYYFALPILNGVAPGSMRTNVVGNINIAYLFALSQFFMAWILAWLYIRRANTVFDPLAEAVRRRARTWREGRG